MAKKKKGRNQNEWKITDIVTILLLLLVGYLFMLMFSEEEENKGISSLFDFDRNQRKHVLPTHQVEPIDERNNVSINYPPWLQRVFQQDTNVHGNNLPGYVKQRGPGAV